MISRFVLSNFASIGAFLLVGWDSQGFGLALILIVGISIADHFKGFE